MRKKSEKTKENIKLDSKSIKLFIDPNDEILDIIDQIAETDTDKVLLVLPKHSLIGSSTVNLKLLSRNLLKLNKASILITPSELATNKAHEAHLIAKNKVEEVNQEVWKDAFLRLEDLKTKIEETKSKLIKERKEDNISVNPPISQRIVEDIQPEAELAPQLSEKTDDLTLEELITETKEAQEVIDELKNPELDKEPTSESLKSDIARIRPTAKIVNVNNFVMLPGGDIKHHPEMRKPVPPEPAEAVEDVKKNIPSNQEKHIESSNTPNHALIGQDITSQKNLEVRKSGLHGERLKPRNNYLGKLFSKKLLIPLIILIPLVFVYRSYAETLELSLEVETKQIELAEQVTGNIETKEVDLTTKKVPVKKTVLSKSMSDSDITTGEGIVGEKATGVMDFFNKTQKEVILPAGTQLTTINKNLTFYLNAQAVIPPAISDITPSKLESVPIIAAEPGEQYNLSDTDVKISGFNANTELSGRIFRAVKGGTSETVKMVSQADVDKLKASLTTTLNNLLTQEIEQSLEKTDIKIPNSSAITEKRFEIDPQVGQEAEEFSIIALEHEMTLLTINQEDLDKLADSIIAEKYNVSDIEEIDEKQPATFENLQIAENGEITFTIRKEGKVQADINETIIKAAIEDQKLDGIGSKLSEIKEIKDYEVKYNPSILPSFLHRIPKDSSKIHITIKSSD